MSDVELKKIELSRTCRTNEHYFTLNCALIGAYKYDSYDSWQWLMVYESSYDDSGSGSFRFSFLFEGNLTRRHQEFWIWSLWAEAIFAYRNCQWRDLLIRQLLSNSYWFIPDRLIKTLYLFIQRQFLDNRRIRTSHNKNRILTHQKSNIWAARFFVLSDQTSSRLKGHRGSHRAL